MSKKSLPGGHGYCSSPSTLTYLWRISARINVQDKQAAKLLKNTSVEEMIAMSIRNKEKELGRPLEEAEKEAIAAKVKAMLGVA